MSLLDLHRPAPATIGLSDRELAIIHGSLRLQRVELTGRREFCGRVGDAEGRDRYAREILELDLIRVKLGDRCQQPTGNKETES
jgi:hypothetical protein